MVPYFFKYKNFHQEKLHANSVSERQLSESVKVLVPQSCPTLCNPTDCSPPGSTVHGIFQARMLEWVAISFTSDSSPHRDQTHVSCIAGGFFTTEPPGKPNLFPTKPQMSFLPTSFGRLALGLQRTTFWSNHLHMGLFASKLVT